MHRGCHNVETRVETHGKMESICYITRTALPHIPTAQTQQILDTQSPFFAFQASHFALPVNSSIPGLSVQRENMYHHYRNGIIHPAQHAVRLITVNAHDKLSLLLVSRNSVYDVDGTCNCSLPCRCSFGSSRNLLSFLIS